MILYEINQKLLELTDPETGELLDYDAYAALQMEKQEKLENTALWIKELLAEASAIREEEKALASRRKATTDKAERLEGYLKEALEGQKFKTARCSVFYRTTAVCKITDPALFVRMNPDYIRISDPEPDKVAALKALKSGVNLAGAELGESVSMQIK